MPMKHSQRNEIFSSVYEKMFVPGIVKFSAEAEFSPSTYPFYDEGYEGQDLLQEIAHPSVTYRINKNGFVGNDFINNSDIVALGCSTTAGMGLPTKYSWPQIVGANLEMSVNQLGLLGGSIQQLSSLFIEFITQFGKPKYLMMLAPDMSRQWLLSEGEPYRDRYFWDEKINGFWCYERNAKMNKQIAGGDVNPKIVAQNSFHSLSNLSNICEMLEISFGFYSWLPEDNFIYQKFNVPNYIVDLSDHQLALDDKKYVKTPENSLFWDMGVDGRHAGAKQHMIYADRFLRFIK